MTDDQRDPELADALAVPPLDDVTHRRLVREALAATDAPATGSGARSWAPLVAAAVVVLLVVVGFVTLGGGGDDSSDTAARKSDRTATAAAPEASPDSAGSNSDASGSIVAGVAAYGDLGDLSAPAARTAAREKVEASGAADTAAGADLSEALLQRINQAKCAAPLRADGTAVVGIGTATVDGRDAAVIVTRATDGARRAHLLVLSPCDLQPL